MGENIAVIRRERQGEPVWLLITQPDHALLSKHLAANWGRQPFVPVGTAMLSAVAHHDNGWEEWEKHPQLDSAGRPCDFTEMPLHAALKIHARSIELCRMFGGLAHWAVSCHFTHLTRQRDDARHDPAAQQFLAEQQREQDQIEQRWSDTGNDTALLKAGLRCLQTFDWMSLWLCIRERTEPETFELPGEPAVTFTPGREAFTVSPWPFNAEKLEFSLPARVVPNRKYRDADELAAVPAQTTTLTWKLVPA